MWILLSTIMQYRWSIGWKSNGRLKIQCSTLAFGGKLVELHRGLV